jgi:hypothetical protein
MSFYELNSMDELVRVLKAYKLVLIEYLDPFRDKESREHYYAFRKLSEIVSRNKDAIAVLVRIDMVPNISGYVDPRKTPLLRVYYDGKIVFEQYGGFSRRDFDLYVLRRSIRDVLYKLGLKYRV